MRAIFATALSCVIVWVAGCASDAPRPQPPEEPAAPAPAPSQPAQAGKPSAPPKAAQDQYLRKLYADPRLDPIRNKVPLVIGPDAVKPAHLSSEVKPSPAEKHAIAVWIRTRERAQQYQTTQRGAPSASLTQTRNRVSAAIVQLYNGELTYAAFARQLQEIDAQYQAGGRRK